jgi:hypothetical protein
MRYLKQGFGEFLGDIFDTIYIPFKKKPISSYLYMIEVAVSVFHSEVERLGMI